MPEIILPNAQDVQDITAKIEEARALLETIETKDFATEETLETRLANLEAQLQQIIDDGVKQSGSIVVDIIKRNVLSKLTIGPEETVILVEDFELAENISSWSFYALEIMRPIDNLITDMKFIIEFTDVEGDYEVGSDGGLVFSQEFDVSDFDEDDKVFVTERGDLGTGSNIIIKEKYFSFPIAKYMRIKIKNNKTTSIMILQKPTIFLEGNF